MTDHDEDILRASLQAEAEGITAGEEMLERIRAASRHPLVSLRHRRWILAVAGLFLLAGTGVVLTSRHEPHRVEVSDGPQGRSTTTTEPGGDHPSDIGDLGAWCALTPTDLAVFMDPDASEAKVAAIRQDLESSDRVASVRYVDAAESLSILAETFADQPDLVASVTEDDVPTAFLVDLVDRNDSDFMADMLRARAGVFQAIQQACPEPRTGPPAQAVAVTEAGHIVVLDTATGDVLRDLGGFDDPTGPEEHRPGGPYSITGLALHPNGRDVYFETCCEPAGGAIFRVPIDGSVPIDPSRLQPLFFGYGSDISADGSRIAFVSGPIVSVVDLESGEVVHRVESADGSNEWVQAALNHDGTVLAIERLLERGPSGEVVRSDVRSLSIGEVDGAYEEHPTTSGRFVPLWLDGGTMLASAPAPGTNPRDSNVDASGQWILEVTADGSLFGRREDVFAIPGGPFTAADW